MMISISGMFARRIFSRILGSRIVLGIGSLLLLMTGVGIVVIFIRCRRMMQTHNGGCPCLAVMRGDRNPRD